MIETFVYQRMRRCGPNRGTAICLGDQIPSVGTRTARELMLELGYQHYVDIDYNGKAHFNLDLNYPLPPGIPKADLLYDGGVMEHVANVSQCLQNIVSLVAVGGILIQAVPVANSYGDAYYAIDPQLQRDFYGANGFEQIEQTLYYRRNLRRLLINLGDRYIPQVERLRSWLRPMKRLKQYAFADIERHVHYLPVNRNYRVLPSRTNVLYLGRKVKEQEKIVWPHQSWYPSNGVTTTPS